MNLIDVVYDRLQRDQQSVMVTVLSGPREGDKIIYDTAGTIIYGEGLDGFIMPQRIEPHLYTAEGIECFVQPIEKDPEVLILGAGHVSRCVADQLLFIGCHVTVVDDRIEYLKEEFFDPRVKRLHLDFRVLKESLPLTSYTGIIVVTRAHEYDSICLHQVRHVLPSYVGVMGSHKRIFHAYEVLKEEGWSDEELDMLYGPIGLDLGAQTPEEIALSIVSEYLAVNRRREGTFLSNRRYVDET